MGLFGRKSKKEPASNSVEQTKSIVKPLGQTDSACITSTAKWSVPHEFPEIIDIVEQFTDTLKYSYPNVPIAGAQYQDIDYSLLKPDRLNIVSEPENQYDEKALRLEFGGRVLGYVPKGSRQDMINDYMANEDRYVMAWLADVDESEKHLTMSLGFYSRQMVDAKFSTTCKLSKTGKKDEDGISRKDNLELCDDGEEVFVVSEMNFDTFETSYIVNGSCGEIGEIPASVIAKIEDQELDPESAVVVVVDSEAGTIRIDCY